MIHDVTSPLALLALLACAVNAFDQPEFRSLALVLRGGESINGLSTNYEQDYLETCYIRFPDNGDLSSGTAGSPGLWDTDFRPNPTTRCSSSVHYHLQKDGNFVFSCSDGTVDYTSHSNEGAGDYFLAIDGRRCQLHIFEGTFGGNEVDIWREVWSSDKYGPWQKRDRLYNGQIYHGLSYYDTVMNPNGNLEVRQPGSRGTYDVVWQASNEWNQPPGNHLKDFYAKLTGGRDLVLVGTDQSGREEVYFRKGLKQTFSGDCFILGFEVVGTDPFGVAPPVDLVAAPCV